MDLILFYEKKFFFKGESLLAHLYFISILLDLQTCSVAIQAATLEKWITFLMNSFIIYLHLSRICFKIDMLDDLLNIRAQNCKISKLSWFNFRWEFIWIFVTVILEIGVWIFEHKFNYDYCWVECWVHFNLKFRAKILIWLQLVFSQIDIEMNYVFGWTETYLWKHFTVKPH